MYFCENPKCLFHENVAKNVYVHTVIFPPIPEPAISLALEPATFSHYSAITREKFLRRNPKKNIEWFLCDVCNEVAKMITENTGE